VEGAGLTAEAPVQAGRERLKVAPDSSGSLGPFGARFEQGTPPGPCAPAGLPEPPEWPPAARLRVLAGFSHSLLPGDGAPIGFESGPSLLPGLTDVLGWDPERAVFPVPGRGDFGLGLVVVSVVPGHAASLLPDLRRHQVEIGLGLFVRFGRLGGRSSL